MQQDVGRGKSVLESTECSLYRYRPGEFDCLASEGGKGGCVGGRVVDKIYVEVGEPQRGLYLLDRRRDGLLQNC